jgi:hypothetical protein
MSGRGWGLGPAKTGGGAVGGPLQLPEFALAGGAPAVVPCPLEVEALATVARLVAQPLSLVPLLARRVHAVEGAAMTLGLHRWRAVGVSWCRGRVRIEDRLGRARP